MILRLSSKCVFLAFASLLAFSSSLQAVDSHDRAFWRDIAKHSYAVPEGASAPALAHELSGLLASQDPELRDDLAYTILAHWIRRNKLSNADLLSLANEWRANLKNRIGESDTESVLLRSFSALCLSEIARVDAKTPFLGAEGYRALLNDALTYLNQERDLRGYDVKLGWIHATAHTADLLRELATNSLLTKADQNSILSAISQRFSTAHDIYTHGEQDRLALVVAAMIERGDFDADAFDHWMRQMQDKDQAMWAHTPIPLDEMARYQNDTYMLEALGARLASPENSKPRPATAVHALASVLKAVQER